MNKIEQNEHDFLFKEGEYADKKEEEPTIDNPLLPERQEGESFLMYQMRRRYINSVLRQRNKGVLVWDTAKLGTYVKPKKK